MNTQPIADTMSTAISNLDKMLLNETILERNTKKLSELNEDEYDRIFNALVEVIEENDKQFKTFDSDSYIQDFELVITENFYGFYRRTYSNFTEDENGNRYPKGDDYEDSRVKWWYNGEIVDLN